MPFKRRIFFPPRETDNIDITTAAKLIGNKDKESEKKIMKIDTRQFGEMSIDG